MLCIYIILFCFPKDDTDMTLSDMMQSLQILTQTLFGSQYEAAKLFEVAYYSVSNFPDVAVQVSAKHFIHMINNFYWMNNLFLPEAGLGLRVL